MACEPQEVIEARKAVDEAWKKHDRLIEAGKPLDGALANALIAESKYSHAYQEWQKSLIVLPQLVMEDELSDYSYSDVTSMAEAA